MQATLSDTNPSREPRVTDRLLQAQVAALYALYPGAYRVSMLAAISYGLFYFWQRHDPLIFGWLVLRLASLPIYVRLTSPQHDPRNDSGNATNWLRGYLWAFAYHGLTWALVPWFFMPADDLLMTASTMLVIMIFCTGGAHGVTHRWSAVLVFILPITSSLILALAVRASNHWYLFLTSIAVLHAVMSLYTARQQHCLLTKSLLDCFENQALSAQLQEKITLIQHISDEKTRFFAAASHDLRQPLHAISLFSTVLEKELQGHPQHVNAQRLMDAVQAQVASLDVMLDVARLDAGVITPQLAALPLNTLFQSLSQLFVPHADEKGLQLRLRATPLWVMSDPHLLQELLVNLVDNAIKYTFTGGVLVLARQRDRNVWIDVIDTGIGISPEQQKHIFEEFYQVDNPGRQRMHGLGIGLAFVRRLSVLLAHPIQLTSYPGRGSRFRVILPRVEAVRQTPLPLFPAIRSTSVEAPPLPQRVLLIDDDADVGHAMGALMQTRGIQLTWVRDEASAHEAIAVAGARRCPFDAAICDLRLNGGTDGLELATFLCQHHELPVLLITGETSLEPLRRVHDTGITVLFKPVAADVLLQALASLDTKNSPR